MSTPSTPTTLSKDDRCLVWTIPGKAVTGRYCSTAAWAGRRPLLYGFRTERGAVFFVVKSCDARWYPWAVKNLPKKALVMLTAKESVIDAKFDPSYVRVYNCVLVDETQPLQKYLCPSGQLQTGFERHLLRKAFVYWFPLEREPRKNECTLQNGQLYTRKNSALANLEGHLLVISREFCNHQSQSTVAGLRFRCRRGKVAY
jgi:hypothetical protein